MHDESRLDMTLASLGARQRPSLPEGFMDGVWMRAGRQEEVSRGRFRLVLMAGMALIGLGSGFGITQAPARAEASGYSLMDGSELSPASLLHVEP